MGIRNIITNIILPLVVLGTISFNAWFLIFERGISGGTFAKLSVQCKTSMPYAVPYTGLPLLDAQLCRLVAFFQVLVDPHNLPSNVELMSFLAALATIPYFEAARPKRNVLLEFQWVIGVVYQKFSAGVILPLYWLLFIVTGVANLHHMPEAGKRSKIDQKYAESILFALFVGFVAPTVSMLVFVNQYATAIWQAFPLWMYIAQFLYLSGRPTSRASGATTIKITLIALFLLSAIPHFYFVMPHFSSPTTLKSFFVPSPTPLDPLSSTVQEGVVDLIKWDVVMTLLGTFAVTFWMAEKSLKGIFGLVAWWVVSSVLFGPGASLVGVFWWREALLNKASVTKIGEKHM